MPYTKIRPRRSTKARWESANPILSEGEIGFEVPDSGIGTGLISMKQGDGVTPWIDLPYALKPTLEALLVDNVLPIEYGGTGGTSIEIVKKIWGFDKVDNTSDRYKPISLPTQDYIDSLIKELKEKTQEDLSDHLLDFNNPHKVTKGQVGLGSVENYAPNELPINITHKVDTFTELTEYDGSELCDILSVASDDLNILYNQMTTHETNYNNPHKVTKDQVGLGNCNNTSDLNKPISTAVQAQINNLIAADNNLLAHINTKIITADYILQTIGNTAEGAYCTTTPDNPDTYTPSGYYIMTRRIVDGPNSLDLTNSHSTFQVYNMPLGGGTIPEHSGIRVRYFYYKL